ncbi:MAG: asparagine synthase B [Roseiflexaceae bacterium]
MCGIAGVFQPGGYAQEARVASMVNQLRHRGPDQSGMLSTPHGVLGHTRLAILDLANGAQPMQIDHQAICFNGEIYNYRSLRERYLADVDFATNSDTEVILRLYQRFGPSCVRLLDGMFAFAIINFANEHADLFLARDPLGIKPLYYDHSNTATWFASEVRALAQATQRIQLLAPGSWYHSRLGTHHYATIGEHWPVAGSFRDRPQALSAIRAIVQLAVRKRMLADVPVGVSLSGGLDSSIIAAIAAQLHPGLQTFAVGMANSSDLVAARQMARQLGTTHHEYIYTQEEIEHALPAVVTSLESCDPALVRSAIPNYFLAKLTAQHVKVILTGEGADELYAGYRYMEAIQSPDQLQQELQTTIAELHRTNLQRADRIFMAFGVEARVPFLDLESIALAFSLPADWKITPAGGLSKRLLRDAFAADLPAVISERPKQKFSSGAGSATSLQAIAEQQITDAELRHEQQRLAKRWGYQLANKEALYYQKILRDSLPEALFLPHMGVSRSL